jgi:hypothetical protein
LGDDNLYDTKCNLIFANYIYSVSRQLKKEALKEISLFVQLYRKALNEIGWKTLNGNNEEQKHHED